MVEQWVYFSPYRDHLFILIAVCCAPVNLDMPDGHGHSTNGYLINKLSADRSLECICENH
jgi:hypothetical protein